MFLMIIRLALTGIVSNIVIARSGGVKVGGATKQSPALN